MSNTNSHDLLSVLDTLEDFVVAGRRRERAEETQAASSGVSETGVSSIGPEEAGTAPLTVLTESERTEALARLIAEITACRACALGAARKNAVPGVGALDPLVMVVGEGPGAEEDAQGLPFVGAAGRYLDKWLEAIELSRDTNAYIANIVKCRPPSNRDPVPEEIETCTPYLARQIELVNPRALLAVGRFAAGFLTGRPDGIGRLRGTVYDYRGRPLIVTYHPSGVLRNPEWRRPVWEDLKLLRDAIDS